MTNIEPKKLYTLLGVVLGFTFKDEVIVLLRETGLLSERLMKLLEDLIEHPLTALAIHDYLDANDGRRVLAALERIGTEIDKELACTGTTLLPASSSELPSGMPSRISTSDPSLEGFSTSETSTESISPSTEESSRSLSTTGRKSDSSTE